MSRILIVKSKSGYIFLKCGELMWVHADKNHLDLHCIDRAHRVRQTLADFNARLDPEKFVRIHRSVIVNTAYIRELRSCGLGDYVVVMKNSRELPVSHTFRSELDRWMSRMQFALSDEAELHDEILQGPALSIVRDPNELSA